MGKRIRRPTGPLNCGECKKAFSNESNELFEFFYILTMNLNKLDLNLFLVFDTIYHEASLTQAALKLNLSQPAVSHALARLRDHLGDPLFTREGRRMVPTAYARTLAPSVRSALNSLQSGLKGPTDFAPEQAERSFVIGMSDVVEAMILPGLMANLQRSAPKVSVSSIRMERHEMAASLRGNRVDLVLDVALPVETDIQHTRLMLERLVVVARHGHPTLASGPLTLPGYLDATHILVSSRRKGLGLEDFELSRLGMRRRVGLRCHHYFAACRVVSQTDLLLTIPEYYARMLQKQLALRIEPFPISSPPELDVHMYWHASADADPTNVWLRQQVAQAIIDAAQQG